MSHLPLRRLLTSLTLAAALGLASGCAHSEPDAAEGDASTQALTARASRVRGSSLRLLLEHREALALTPEQVQQLLEKQEVLRAQQKPLRKELRALKVAARRGEEASREEARTRRKALRAQLRAADAQAFAEAQTLLADGQREQAQSLLAEREQQRHTRRDAHARG